MKNFTKLGAKINTKIGKAINDHALIKDGDHILAAVSGGKDSLTMLYFLKEIRSWAPIKFNVTAIHVKTDFSCGGCMHETTISDTLRKMDIKCVFKDIKVLDEKGQTSCFWCSWNRRKAFFEAAEELGCNKIALGHHKDDIAETILMNLLYKGEISGMNPYQDLFGGKLAIIRPLCYIEEERIIAFAEETGFPKQKCKCPFGKTSERKHIKAFIKSTEEKLPGTGIRTNIVKSLSRIKNEYTLT
ncbi:MAG: tRNA 2-thiocytidine biosynthesis TtcA family protein [Candidatus Omnitrophota bacterium]